MKKDKTSPKEHYQQMRVLSCERLWTAEVPKFDAATPQQRMEQVGVIRAVGVVFAESGTAAQKEQARQWLQSLLRDPAEKVRRYAMVALPKIGAADQEEGELLTLLKKTSSDREKKFLAQTLEKIGGAATLEVAGDEGLARTAQKVEANLARAQKPSTILFDKSFPEFENVRIHLRGRSGLEDIIEEEVQIEAKAGGKFRAVFKARALVAVVPSKPFSLADIYGLRCFSDAGIVLGTVKLTKKDREDDEDDADLEALADIISSPTTLRIFEAFTEGPLRYRLEFASKGHQRSAVRRVTNLVYSLEPKLLNDSRSAPWEINIFHTPQGLSVELSPKLRPDPRFAYRLRDIPAASHPPLAACMARLAGPATGETVWDPFCGSGLELIERALLGGVKHLYGTDRSEEAIEITRGNLASAIAQPPAATLTCCDFRDHAKLAGIRPGSLSLIVSNPPMGKRVPVANLRFLIEDLFAAATVALRPGGRLVFANPLPIKPGGHQLKLQYRQKVDLGGFHCHLEKYVKLAPGTPGEEGAPFSRSAERPRQARPDRNTPRENFRRRR